MEDIEWEVFYPLMILMSDKLLLVVIKTPSLIGTLGVSKRRKLTPLMIKPWMPFNVLLMWQNLIGYPLSNSKRNLRIIWGYSWGYLLSKIFKISLVTHKYDVFKVEEGETVKVMYNGSNDIILGLKGLWNVIGKAKLNCKLLLALPKGWYPKVMTIEEDEGLATMTMEELLECFITHKHTLQMDKEEMEINNKKKDLALKILIPREEDDLDGEMTLIVRNFKFLRKQVGAIISSRQLRSWG